MQGRPDLPVGSYVLDEDKQAPEHHRRILDDVRIAVLERDEFACRVCGWSLAQLRPEDPRKFLELHQVEHHHGAYGQEQGGNVAVGPDALLQSSTPGPTKRLPRALVRAEAWKRQLMEGRAPNLEAIAKAEDVTAAYAARLIRVAFLAPDLKRAIDEAVSRQD